MKVSILCYNLSGNSLGRAYLLAELLEQNYDVEIIGPKFNGDIWSPLNEKKEYKSIEASPFLHRFPFVANQLLKLIDGDVVIASKPRTSSYGIGLLKKITSQKPLLLDIDDWESGFYFDQSVDPYIYNIPHLVSCNSFYYTRLLELGSKYADEITVSNTFLQSKFSGELIPHVRDTDKLSPSNFDKQRSRQRLGIPMDEDIVMFAGSPEPYKGVEDLIAAFPLSDDPDCQLYIVGAGDSDYSDYIRNVAGENVQIYGKKPFDQIPYWVASADVVTIPQRARNSTRGQLPAKLFDAMALGKPIIATAVADMPRVLEEVGIIINPESPKEMDVGLTNLINDRTQRKKLGEAARRKCVAEYSYIKYAPILGGIIENAV